MYDDGNSIKCYTEIYRERQANKNKYVYFLNVENEYVEKNIFEIGEKLQFKQTIKEDMVIVPQDQISLLEANCARGILEMQTFQFDRQIYGKDNYCDGETILKLRFISSEEVCFKKFFNFKILLNLV